jgi:hypothetical protein
MGAKLGSFWPGAAGKARHFGLLSLLESLRRDSSFQDIAGLLRPREWLIKRKSALTPEGQKFGLVPPKGIMIAAASG